MNELPYSCFGMTPLMVSIDGVHFYVVPDDMTADEFVAQLRNDTNDPERGGSLMAGNGKDKPGESDKDKKGIEIIKKAGKEAWEKKHPPEEPDK